MVDAISGLGGVSSLRGVGALGDTSRVRQYSTSEAQAVNQTQESFADSMAQALNSTSQDLKSAEAASIGGMRGETSAQNVVEAVMKAELSLQSALAIRDKVVEAYQEFSRMSI
ncbi:flagellar hook-basal body protein FliE [Rhodobacteraceae bacterium RKSG542]|uniref:flagellar hook-basal body complex protein FliE n=1 Tax=Pseudovibrio flavus TaxID=2529854 RepID=UPI0012BC5644|nr:flagellar hook-basal body complex protein FliE [Pseudovibrio flavus]MTI16932.1 flagellar hook-basal body protein FliE [Pseudovibrio flavus]